MSELTFHDDVKLAGSMLFGLRMLCEERAKVTGFSLSSDALEQIAMVLKALGYRDFHGSGNEWRAALAYCLRPES